MSRLYSEYVRGALPTSVYEKHDEGNLGDAMPIEPIETSKQANVLATLEKKVEYVFQG